MKIIISNQSAVPIYEQIKEQIKEAIFTDQLAENDQLPSIRQLAKDLRISVITTTRAYKDLEEEGYVVNVQGKGCYVLPKNKEFAYENTIRKIESLFETILELGAVHQLDQKTLIDIFKNYAKESDYE